MIELRSSFAQVQRPTLCVRAPRVRQKPRRPAEQSCFRSSTGHVLQRCARILQGFCNLLTTSWSTLKAVASSSGIFSLTGDMVCIFIIWQIQLRCMCSGYVWVQIVFETSTQRHCLWVWRVAIERQIGSKTPRWQYAPLINHSLLDPQSVPPQVGVLTSQGCMETCCQRVRC